MHSGDADFDWVDALAFQHLAIHEEPVEEDVEPRGFHILL
jgi:hypothetical protein